MKTIKILGTGCAKCTQLYERVKKVADAMGIEYELIKVTDMNEILSFGIMMTPGIVVNNEVKVSGRVPKENEIEEMIV